jgi:hypothetical protein
MRDVAGVLATNLPVWRNGVAAPPSASLSIQRTADAEPFLQP